MTLETIDCSDMTETKILPPSRQFFLVGPCTVGLSAFFIVYVSVDVWVYTLYVWISVYIHILFQHVILFFKLYCKCCLVGRIVQTWDTGTSKPGEDSNQHILNDHHLYSYKAA